MARVTVHIPNDVLTQAEYKWHADRKGATVGVNRSAVVTEALEEYIRAPDRSGASGRGRIETLRALRTAMWALADVERTLTQDRPVKRRVKRVR